MAQTKFGVETGLRRANFMQGSFGDFGRVGFSEYCVFPKKGDPCEQDFFTVVAGCVLFQGDVEPFKGLTISWKAGRRARIFSVAQHGHGFGRTIGLVWMNFSTSANMAMRINWIFSRLSDGVFSSSAVSRRSNA
jgi:hypothetical protein